jgi:hypothetical protein
MKMKMKQSAVKAALKPTDKLSATATAPSASSASKALAPTPSTYGATKALSTAPSATSATKAVTTAQSANCTCKAVTTIEVKMDVGFGNAVYLRGQGAGLTWEHGQPLVCVDAKTWRWTGEVKDPIKFKLLLNDKIWSAGNDLVIAPGQKIEIAPEFAV